MWNNKPNEDCIMDLHLQILYITRSFGSRICALEQACGFSCLEPSQFCTDLSLHREAMLDFLILDRLISK